MNDLALTITDVKVLKDQEGALTIEGYANTIDKDRYGDIVLPSAFNMTNYEKNPVLLLGHDHNKPIGTVIDYEIRENGLFIKAKISDAAEELYKVKTLISDGVLKALSIGFRLMKGKYVPEEDIYVIQELELLEISVVSVPANQDSLFEVSKSFKDLKDKARNKVLMKDEKKVADSEKAIIITTTTESSETEKEVETISIVDDGESTPAESAAAAAILAGKSVSETEQKNSKEKEEINMDEIQKAVAAEIEKARLAEAEKAAEAERKAIEEAEKKAAEDARIAEAVEKALASHKEKEEKEAGIPAHEKDLEVPTMTLSMEEQREYVKKIDDLYLLSVCMGKPITELKAFKDLPKAVTKAVTNTGGTSLAPVGFDTRLMEDIRRALKIEPLFANFNMPLADYRLPFNAAGVSAAWTTAGSAPADQTVVFNSVLFTAKKLMSAVGFNYEDEDDAVIALLPTIRQELAYGMAEILENTLVSGTGAANDFRGMSHYAAGAGASHISTIAGGIGADFTPSAVAAARAKMGRYGLDPSKIVLLINLSDYYKLVDDTLVQTVQNFGPQATLLKGQLATIWGIPIIPTEAIATPAIVGDTRAVLVRPDRFKIGYRKGMMVEAYRLPTDQTKNLTASMRLDFNPLVPLTAGQLAADQTFVININVAA